MYPTLYSSKQYFTCNQRYIHYSTVTLTDKIEDWHFSSSSLWGKINPFQKSCYRALILKAETGSDSVSSFWLDVSSARTASPPQLRAVQEGEDSVRQRGQASPLGWTGSTDPCATSPGHISPASTCVCEDALCSAWFAFCFFSRADGGIVACVKVRIYAALWMRACVCVRGCGLRNHRMCDCARLALPLASVGSVVRRCGAAPSWSDDLTKTLRVSDGAQIGYDWDIKVKGALLCQRLFSCSYWRQDQAAATVMRCRTFRCLAEYEPFWLCLTPAGVWFCEFYFVKTKYWLKMISLKCVVSRCKASLEVGPVL